MSTEIIVAIIALVAGPLSAVMSYRLTARARRIEEKSKAAAFDLELSRAREAIEKDLWERTQKELGRAYDRCDKMDKQIADLKADLADERSRRLALEIELNSLKRERRDLQDENATLKARVDVLERRIGTAPLSE